MHLRAFSPAALVLALAVLPACDKQEPAKTDPKAKVEEKKTDAKVEEKKAEEKKADEVKADEGGAEGKADEAKADDGGAEGKADEAKADEAKADEAKADEKKADEAKADEKKADEKKADTKKADPKKPDETKADPPATGGADGKDIYGKKCKSCHGASGDAKTKIGEENDIEDWTQAGWKGKWPESKVVDIVTNGKAGTKMKAFKDKLTADEIAAVSKYARSLGK